jgi:hypothetical protein
MLIQRISTALQADSDVRQSIAPPDRRDLPADQEWRRVGSLDKWPLFGRLLVWATRHNHPPSQ